MKQKLVTILSLLLPLTINSQSWEVFGIDTISPECKTYSHITVFNNVPWYGLSKLEGLTFAAVETPSLLFACDISKSDRNGNIWFVGSIRPDIWTTHGNAFTVYKFDGSNWFDYSPPKSYGYNNCKSITFQNSGKMWFTTSDSGAYMYDGLTWFHYINKGIFEGANSMEIDNDGNKWFATQNGLVKYDGSNYTTFNAFNSGLKFNVVNDLALDKNGNIWLATGSPDDLGDTIIGRVAKFDGSDWTYYKTFNDSQGLNYVSAIAIDSNEKIWAGTFLGLSVFDGNNWTNHTYPQTVSENLQLLSIDFDSSGNTWFGTSCGVLKFRDNMVNVKDYHSSKHLSISPNPANSIINICLNTPVENMEISIFSIMGTSVYKNDFYSNSTQLNISSFKKGIYFICVKTGLHSSSTQIIKE